MLWTVIYDEGEDEPKQEFRIRSEALSYIESLQRNFDSEYDMLGKLENMRTYEF